MCNEFIAETLLSVPIDSGVIEKIQSDVIEMSKQVSDNLSVDAVAESISWKWRGVLNPDSKNGGAEE